MTCDLSAFTTSCGYLRCTPCYDGPRYSELADVCEYAGKTLPELIVAAEEHYATHHAPKEPR